MFRLPIFLTLIAGLLLSSACSSTLFNPAGEGRTQQARILLWHTWDAEQAAVLDGMLATYQELHPHVEVISVAVAEDNLVTQLNNRSRAGLGPDLILADAGQIYRMAESGLIRDLAPLNLELSDYLSTALNMLSDDTRLYGLPMATHTHVLYYNRNLVTTPPVTIDELVERTEAGEILAQSPHFIDYLLGHRRARWRHGR